MKHRESGSEIPQDDARHAEDTDSGGGKVTPKKSTKGPKIDCNAALMLASELLKLGTKRIVGLAEAITAHAAKSPLEQFVAQFERLYKSNENVTVVSQFTMVDDKVRPFGNGVTKTCEMWVKLATRSDRIPEREAGAWFVVNPTDGHGIQDCNVVDYRYLLLESDMLPSELQLAVLEVLPLPIISITASGRRSYHAIIQVDAPNLASYKAIASKLFSLLKNLGFDTSCRNPARLTRLGGATRGCDVEQRALQQLIYLRPETTDAINIEESIASLRELIESVRQSRLKAAQDKHPFYYDSGTRLYWRTNDQGRFISVDEKSVSRALAVEMGLSRKSDGGGSEVECSLNSIQTQFDVAYAGPLAGFKEGVHQDENRRLLVTEGPKLITPNKGEWPLLESLFQRMFVTSGIDQRPFVFGWLKCALECLQSGYRRPGQALVLSGPAGSGKSLFQALVTQILGGRSERAFTYISGETGFNGELFGAEHLIIEDEMATRDMRSRRQIGTAIKGLVANETQRCRKMRTEGISLRPMWRVTISLNEAPEDLLVLPPLDEGLRDKFIMLAVTDGPTPIPISTPEDRHRMWKALVAELPAFLAYLNSWDIPEEFRHSRYGIKEFQHPMILTALKDLAPEERFLEIIDAVLFLPSDGLDEIEAPDPSDVEWRGSAIQLETALHRLKFDRELEKLLSFTNAAGTFLRRLSVQYPQRISSVTVRGKTVWVIQPPEST